MLRGYSWIKRTQQYRRIKTGTPVSRASILKKLDRSINGRDERIQKHVIAAMEGRISPNSFGVMEHLLLKRQALQSVALVSGGWDQLTQRDYGRVGAMLRGQYAKLAALTEEIAAGTVSPAQAMNRTHMYLGETRSLAISVEREHLPLPAAGKTRIERRLLDPAAQHCRQCPEYYRSGWQPAGTLPSPGQACDCMGNCRCTLITREVPTEDAIRYMGRSGKDGKILAQEGT